VKQLVASANHRFDRIMAMPSTTEAERAAKDEAKEKWIEDFAKASKVIGVISRVSEEISQDMVVVVNHIKDVAAHLSNASH
jgi:hypothetical protein